MPSGEWQYQARGGTHTLVLLPGWATDARIFAGLATGADLISPRGLLAAAPVGLAERLAGITSPVLLLGWSLGGYAAAWFARCYPELVARVILAGVRPHYPAAQLAAMRDALTRDRAACLTTFYRQCFLPAQRTDYRRFRTELEPAYQAEFPTDALLAGLDYLEASMLAPASLPPVPTTLVHGAQDVIAPIKETRRLADESGLPMRVVPDAAHAVFLTAPCRDDVDDARNDC